MARVVVQVNVSAPTNLDNRTGFFPDPVPLLDTRNGTTLPADTTTSLWITAFVPEGTPPGALSATVSICAGQGGVVTSFALSLRVWGFSVSNRTQITDSGFNGLETHSELARADWPKTQREQYPNLTRSAVLSSWYTSLSTHRVNWMAYTQLLPRIVVNITDDTSLKVTLESSAFEAAVEQLLAHGVARIAFPMPIERNAGLAGGWNTTSGRVFHGHKADWPHCILPNATWLFAPGVKLPVFDTEKTSWISSEPVLSARFVAYFHGAIAKRLDDRGWMEHVNVVWLKDEPEYADPFTLASLVLLQQLVKSVHPALTIYQTRLPIWPYRPSLNATLVEQLKDLVDYWFHSAAPLGAEVQTVQGRPWPAREQAIGQIAELRRRGKTVCHYDNSVNAIDMPWHRVRLYPWMIWLTDSGLWRPRNATAVTEQSLGLQGALSWYCDDCGAGFHDPWKSPEETSKKLWAGGGPFILYPPRPEAARGPSEEIMTPSIRWELYRKGLEDVERFYLLQRLHQRAASSRNALPMQIANCGLVALEQINGLVWDFPAMRAAPWGDGYAQPGWTVAEEDVTYSTNTTAMTETLYTVASCIEALSIALREHKVPA